LRYYKRKYAAESTAISISFESTMTTQVKRGSQRLSRRKETLLKKAHEMGMLCDVDVALYIRIRKSGRLITYKSINRQCWPPTEEQIVSASEDCENHTNKAVATHLSDPIGPAARGHGSEVWRGLDD
jgi:hypothetical protein